jgi:hypothetical protein
MPNIHLQHIYGTHTDIHITYKYMQEKLLLIILTMAMPVITMVFLELSLWLYHSTITFSK